MRIHRNTQMRILIRAAVISLLAASAAQAQQAFTSWGQNYQGQGNVPAGEAFTSLSLGGLHSVGGLPPDS